MTHATRQPNITMAEPWRRPSHSPLRKQRNSIQPLIVQAALLAPEPIPLFLFSEAREKFGEPLASALASDGLGEALAALRTFALIDRETIAHERNPASQSRRSVCIGLCARSRWRRDVGSRDELRRTLIASLAAVFPTGAYRNPETWGRCAPLVPHLLSICEMQIDEAAANIERADLLDRAASYFHGRAAYSIARSLFDRALAISEMAHGPEHSGTLRSLNNLAGLLQDQGDIAGARSLFERALAIYEKVLGAEHHITARSLSYLAGLLQAEGHIARARHLFERALTIREKALGSEHPDTASSLHDLALLLRNQSDLTAARPLFERALAIREKALGPEDSHTNQARCNFADLLLAKGDAAEALASGEVALTAHRRLLGKDHPWTKNSARVTANALAALGRTEDATALRERYGVGADPPAPA